MPIPRRIIEKRRLNRVDFLEHVKTHLIETCEDDSLHDSLATLESLELMCGFKFQHMLYAVPLSKQQREEMERNYMAAVWPWR